ncbi:AzlC family ABC transporter permease [Staphylococcus coagulans]|uniref:AzlC family ABC transporter permease n=1 Tax=Staphylococcus coagulans TaxID=74706 RepID=UPI001BEC1725|nr:AzlC family ABC transporter permease [Staphylococcus coagulans]MBT2831107.1 AzlC family ABC transporter permease [Staphylococcus coagulans]MBT2859558.1 AzlC family ABC transporter permease [Staphylococcus coagulans]MBU3873068.1 AzlC family ABC transporter permease [Staphylococcus coagulans]UNB48599.1 AzlC family ABC transporter permease [Staphylococcus coagulans]
MVSHTTFKQGVQECIPTLLGYAGIGFSFGVVGVASGFGLLEIVMLSMLVYAGAAQFIIVALMVVHTPVWIIVLTTLIVNSRMFLLSMTLANNFKQESLLHRVGVGALLTDETFAVAITPHSKDLTITRNWMYGLNLTAYLFWIFVSILGALLGNFFKNPDAFGLDYAIIAMFVFLTIAQFEGITKSKMRTYLLLMLIVIVMMLSLSMVMSSYLAILFASTITAAIGMVIDR